MHVTGHIKMSNTDLAVIATYQGQIHIASLKLSTTLAKLLIFGYEK